MVSRSPFCDHGRRAILRLPSVPVSHLAGKQHVEGGADEDALAVVPGLPPRYSRELRRSNAVAAPVKARAQARTTPLRADRASRMSARSGGQRVDSAP